VAGEDDGHAVLPHPLLERLGEDVDADRVEAGEGLVEHQDVRRVHQRGGELHALLVAERERLHAVTGPVGQAEPLDPVVGRRAGVAPARPVELAR
jgi:hypothetical protein